MGIIRFAIQNPVKVTVGVLLLSIFGLLSMFSIPIQLTPNVDKPTITVTTYWEGANPQEIEREIVERQEEKLKGVTGLYKMTSTSIDNEASVELEFYVDVDKDAALRDVSDKLRQVTGYPGDVDEPTIQAADSAFNSPIAWLIFFAAPGEDPAKLKDFAEDKIKPVLERANGVASVEVYGGREREVQIQVDAARMAARGITFGQLELALRRQNRNIAAGSISSGKRDYTWRTLGQFETPQQVENTVIDYQVGGPVYVRDVARVHVGHKKQYSFVRSVGQPVLAFPVRRETGSNVIQVMDNLKVQINKVNAELLEPLGRELRLTQVYDETVYIHSAIGLVRNNLLYGGILAVIFLMLFLRSPTATGIVALCIPISVIGSFLVVTMLGRTLNVIMLAGMAFAVGMVVDNSIVVLENIYRHLQMGKHKAQAAFDGAVEVWGAVLASTLTTLAVFLPVIFIQEEAGQLFRDIAIAISSAVGLSLVVAMTVIPTVSARALRITSDKQKTQENPHGPLQRLIGNVVHTINGRYSTRVLLSAVLIAVSLFGSWALVAPTDYLPGGNRNLVFGFLITPPGYSLNEFLRMGTVIEDTVAPYWRIDQESAPDEKKALDRKWDDTAVEQIRQQLAQAQALVESTAKLGNAPEDIAQKQGALDAVMGVKEQLRNYENPPPTIDNFFYVAFNGRCFMGATSHEEGYVRPLVNLLTHAGSRVPGTFAIFFQTSLFGDLGGAGNTIELEIRGDDLAAVTKTAELLSMKIMGRFGYAQPDPANFDLGRPEIQIIPDRVRAAEVGLNVQDVGRIVEACVDGAFVAGGYREQGDEIDLTIQVQGTKGATPEEIAQVPVFTPSGQIITLGSVVNTIKTTAPQQINHIEEMPSVTLTVRPPDDMPLETATSILNDEIVKPLRDGGQIPRDVFTVAAGNAKKLDETREALFGRWTGWNLDSLISIATSRGGLAILITYLLMSALFESFAYPFVIMFTVLPATVGGFACLRVIHEWSAMDTTTPTIKLDVLTMLGFVILVGIVVNNAILLVHQALNHMRHHGMPPRDAITESVRTRLRPIFMTALTSVGGMAPLVFSPGAGSELYRGLGSVVVGGLLISTVFTLILVPTLFSLFIDIQAKILGRAALESASVRSNAIGT